MTSQIGSNVSVVFIALLVALAGATLADAPASATDDCIAAPKSPAPQGSHWYYRTDREKRRKCWYLGPQGLNVHRIAPEAAPPMQPVAQPPAAPREDRTNSAATANPVEQLAPQNLPANAPGDAWATLDVWTRLDANPLQPRDLPNQPDTVGRGGFMAGVSNGQVPPETEAPDTDGSNEAPVEPLAAAANQRTDPALFIAGMLTVAALILAAFASFGWRRRKLASGHGAARRSTVAPKFSRTIFDIKKVPPLPPIGYLEPPLDDKELLRRLLRHLEGARPRQFA